MQIHTTGRSLATAEVDAVVVGVCKEADLRGAAAELDEVLGGALRRLIEAGEGKGETGEVLVYHPDGRLPARCVIMAGLGPADKLDAEKVRRAAGTAAKAARAKGARRLGMSLLGAAEGLAPAEAAVAVTEGVLLGLYRFQEYKSKKEEKEISEVVVCAGSDEAAVLAAVERGRILAEATMLARDLAVQPGNKMTPRLLADAAARMAAGAGLEIDIFDEERIAQEGMGAFLGVAKGSHEPPRFIILRYRSGRADSPVLALVGKGITFDSGGISIKPGEGMEEMRMDKSGAAAVIGAMQAIARLKPHVDVVALIPATENMPGGRAQKPGDIVTALNGKTIEVINTDAEGRLILADAVAYAAKLGARWIVDIATLTGAVVICLGNQAAAVLGNDDELVEEVRRAGADVGERFWPMPTFEEYKEQYKSTMADIKNIGGRPAGTITGGLIIGEFVGETAWAHLDIAGVAWHDKELPYKPKGASGFGTRTLVRLAERLAEKG